MTQETITSSNSAVIPSLPLKPGSPASLEKQYANALAEKYGDDLGKFSLKDIAAEQAVKREPQTTPQENPKPNVQTVLSQAEVIVEPEEEQDEFVKLFGRKTDSHVNQDGIDSDINQESTLPLELTLEDLAQTYKTTPEKLLESLRIKTKVGTDERALSLKEVVKGYQTDKHVTQKSQAIAQREKEVEGIRAQAAEQKAMLDQSLYVANGLLENQFKQLEAEFAAKDWNRMRIEDPTEYAIQRQEYGERRGKLDHEMRQLGNMYWQSQNELKSKEQQAQSQQKQNALERQTLEKQKLYEQMPALRDPTKAQMYQKELIGYLEKLGVPESEYNSELFSQAWVYHVLNDAMLYNRMTKGDLKEKIVKAVSVQPKTSGRQSQDSVKAQATEDKGLFDRFATTKNPRDAAAWLEKRGFK